MGVPGSRGRGRGAAVQQGRGGKAGRAGQGPAGSGGKGRGAQAQQGLDAKLGAKGQEPAGAAREPAPGAGKADGEAGTQATKALVTALRAFSSSKWWQIGSSDEAPTRKRAKPDEFQRHCAEKHAEMNKVYESAMMQDSEQRWLRKVSAEGTAADRVSSLIMLVQVCPVFSTRHIKALLGMAGNTTRNDSIMAVDGLKELFIGTLLPDRRLRTLAQMEPISPKGLSRTAFTERCVVAYFEDYLKTAFAAFVQILSEVAHATLAFFKTKAVRAAHELLAAKPEQERALLGLLVNKLGDSTPRVSSSVVACLQELLEVHPAMKLVVARELEAFLLRANVPHRAQYRAVVYLSELPLSRKDGELAAQLVRLFVVRLEEALKGAPRGKAADKDKRRRSWRKRKAAARRSRRGVQEADNRLVRAIVNGLQRTLPYLDAALLSSPLQAETQDALFRVCHTVSAFSTRTAIMALLYKCLGARGDAPDRFYQLVHEQLREFELFASATKLQTLLLLQRVVGQDASLARGLALTRRLLQLGAHAEPPLAAGALGVLRELLATRGAEVRPLLQSLDAQVRPPEHEDDLEEHFRDDAPGAEGPAAAARERYLPAKREPRFSRAQHTPLWELYALTCHVHPFVAHGASRLISAELFEDASTNPFEAFSCGELLEQFLYVSRARKGQKQKAVTPQAPVNSSSFAKRKSFAPHEEFFQLYFHDTIIRQRQKQKVKSKIQKEDFFDEDEGQELHSKPGEDAYEEADAEEDQFFDEYLKGQMPKLDQEDGEEDIDGDEDSLEDVADGESVGAGDDFDGGECAEDGNHGSAPDVEGEELADGAKKRAAEEVNLPREGQLKRLKKRHSGSIFASAEDFSHLLSKEDL